MISDEVMQLILAHNGQDRSEIMSDKHISDIVEEALLEVLPEMEDYEEGDSCRMMTICFCSNSDKNKDYAYPLLYSNGVMPNHHARTTRPNEP